MKVAIAILFILFLPVEGKATPQEQGRQAWVNALFCVDSRIVYDGDKPKKNEIRGAISGCAKQIENYVSSLILSSSAGERDRRQITRRVKKDLEGTVLSFYSKYEAIKKQIEGD